MLAELSGRIANAWAENHVIPGEEKAVYQYGIELVLSILINLCCLILISIVVGQALAWVFYLLSFVPLRTAGGGYHAPTHATCILITSGMFCGALLLSLRLPDASAPMFCGVTAVFSLVIFGRLAPVAAANKPLTEGEVSWNRKISRLLVCVVSALVLFGVAEQWSTHLGLKLLCSGEGIAAINLIIGLISCGRKCPQSR